MSAAKTDTAVFTKLNKVLFLFFRDSIMIIDKFMSNGKIEHNLPDKVILKFSVITSNKKSFSSALYIFQIGGVVIKSKFKNSIDREA
mmetsp:Transcript_86139/g.229924  ORF Transcript_86139/g.229924 Transcript_86139/m.229924 type:complete len:87 (+) Transcript_86139:1845-2105(+)